MRPDIKNYVPLGVDGNHEFRWTIWAMICSAVYSLGFFFRYLNYYGDLFEWRDGEKILKAGAVMEDFTVILGGYLNGFAAVAVCMAGLAAYHYAYHYQGSRSIYTMRRLPSRAELWKRCLALPAAAIALSALAAFALMLLYYGVYMAATPEKCLTPGQWRKIWSLK